MKNRIIAFSVFAVSAVCFFTGCTRKDEMTFETKEMAELSEAASEDVHKAEASQDEEASQEEAAAASRIVYVDICGAVENPGVYALREDARVFEAVEAAGGLSEDASSESVNQAEKVTDGQKIYIMNQTEWNEAKEKGTAAAVSDSGTASGGKVNINTASESELCTLPGIGATRAAAIIAYRESCGGFSSIEEIQCVSGIKSGTYEKICEFIIVN